MDSRIVIGFVSVFLSILFSNCSYSYLISFKDPCDVGVQRTALKEVFLEQYNAYFDKFVPSDTIIHSGKCKDSAEYCTDGEHGVITVKKDTNSIQFGSSNNLIRTYSLPDLQFSYWPKSSAISSFTSDTIGSYWHKGLFVPLSQKVVSYNRSESTPDILGNKTVTTSKEIEISYTNPIAFSALSNVKRISIVENRTQRNPGIVGSFGIGAVLLLLNLCLPADNPNTRQAINITGLCFAVPGILLLTLPSPRPIILYNNP